MGQNGARSDDPTQLLKGFSLLEVLIAISLVSIVGVVIAQLMTKVQQSDRESMIRLKAREILENVTAIAKNDSAWGYTLRDEKNKSFECILEQEDCRDQSEKATPFVLRNASDQIWIDPGNEKMGFGLNGGPCEQFPSRSCPFKMSLAWKPVCPPPQEKSQEKKKEPPPCIAPNLDLHGQLTYQAEPPVYLPPSLYSIRVFRGAVPVGLVFKNKPTSELAKVVCGLVGKEGSGNVFEAQTRMALSALGLNEEQSKKALEDFYEECEEFK